MGYSKILILILSLGILACFPRHRQENTTVIPDSHQEKKESSILDQEKTEAKEGKVSAHKLDKTEQDTIPQENKTAEIVSPSVVQENKTAEIVSPSVVQENKT
ncbi:MAG: hypothetical protein HUU50_22725, partial [Candidatus Brocadiae bacterium]|nr:hypothetical protein [Candidatus Brocadiia bacterium]